MTILYEETEEERKKLKRERGTAGDDIDRLTCFDF
jgi:hypothetical protein